MGGPKGGSDDDDNECDDYDDDDYDDFDADDHAATLSDNEDFLEDYEDDASVTSASTTVSTGEYFKMFE